MSHVSVNFDRSGFFQDINCALPRDRLQELVDEGVVGAVSKEHFSFMGATPCALAHYLEEEGLATTTIALIRKHAETVQPPRALWVPFELGRPVGPPNNPQFQRQVVEAALALLDRTDGPVVLEDFPHEAPGEEDNPAWKPPSIESGADIGTEIQSLSALVSESEATRGYSNVGITGLPLETVAEFILRIDSDDPMPRPTPRLAPVQVLRFGADDLKAYYAEAGLAGTAQPSSRQLWAWFWRETLAGKAILELRKASLESEQASRQGIAKSLVPELWLEDPQVMQRF
jgi:hypothetical protein